MDGVAATYTVPLVPLLPDALQPYFSDINAGLVLGSTERERRAVLQEANAARYAWGFNNRREYGAVARRMYDVGMLALQLQLPLIVNGMFGVPKPSLENPDQQRVSTDARPKNVVYAIPWQVRLPNPSTFANLVIPRGQRLWIGKFDVDSMFHWFLLPDWQWELQGLEPVLAVDMLRPDDVAWVELTNPPEVKIFKRDELANGEVPPGVILVGHNDIGRLWIYPRVRSMLMGWTGSVHCAQAVFKNIVRTADSELELKLLTGQLPHLLRGDDVAEAVYIDNYMCLGIELAPVGKRFNTVPSHANTCGLRESE